MSAAAGRRFTDLPLQTYCSVLPVAQVYPTAPGMHISKSASHATAATGSHSVERQHKRLTATIGYGLYIVFERFGCILRTKIASSGNTVKTNVLEFCKYREVTSSVFCKVHWDVSFLK